MKPWSTYEKQHKTFVRLDLSYITHYNFFQFHSFICKFHYPSDLNQLMLCICICLSQGSIDVNRHYDQCNPNKESTSLGLAYSFRVYSITSVAGNMAAFKHTWCRRSSLKVLHPDLQAAERELLYWLGPMKTHSQWKVFSNKATVVSTRTHL